MSKSTTTWRWCWPLPHRSTCDLNLKAFLIAPPIVDLRIDTHTKLQSCDNHLLSARPMRSCVWLLRSIMRVQLRKRDFSTWKWSQLKTKRFLASRTVLSAWASMWTSGRLWPLSLKIMDMWIESLKHEAETHWSAAGTRLHIGALVLTDLCFRKYRRPQVWLM